MNETTPLVDSCKPQGRSETRYSHELVKRRCFSLLVTAFLFICCLCIHEVLTIIANTTRATKQQWFHTEPAIIQVPRGLPSFPSFWDYHGGPIQVSADRRSIRFNRTQVLLIGGSMHPVRATPGTWELMLDEAVRNGLNLITMYVVWSAHQPFPNQPMNWNILNTIMTNTTAGEESRRLTVWELADAIVSCAQRGLFVHIRIGPYVCAEYSYGGIPEWLPLQHPTMRMRRLDPEWMEAMEEYVNLTASYLAEHQLWASQGGPIIMAQIENELGGETGDFMEASNTSIGSSEMQEYADWCGEMAAKYVPSEVILTMCNGLSAENTIVTHNGDSQLISWLGSHGDSGRIQVDQPALWTEDEGGFQLWGEESSHPTDYFWGHTARYMSKRAMQWFARGGSHLNYYMWWGGYNRGRAAAAGTMNAYATDAVMCSSGDRHEPKYSHFQRMHTSLSDIAPVLLKAESALFHNQSVQIWHDSHWETGSLQSVFRYRATVNQQHREVLFVENNANSQKKVKVSLISPPHEIIYVMGPDSAILILDGVVIFDSGSIDPRAKGFRRVSTAAPIAVNWTIYSEPLNSTGLVIESPLPVEQTALNFMQHSWSDYALYGTSFHLTNHTETLSVTIETQKANAMLVYVNGAFLGSSNNHDHSEGTVMLSMSSNISLSQGNHRLSILSVSLGYHNLIGRWASNVGPKRKGIVGQVCLFSSYHSECLVDGRNWTSRGGLASTKDLTTASSHASPRWLVGHFLTPQYDSHHSKMLAKFSSGRGHFFLNGFDLGRYWNITRGSSSYPSQSTYLLPPDLLRPKKAANVIRIFDAFGLATPPEFILSWIEKTGNEDDSFPDVVDFAAACV